MIALKSFLPKGMRRILRFSLSLLPDSISIRILYYIATRKRLNLKNPRGFNEKLNWMKLHDRHPEYQIYVDKLAVRNHIKEVLGEQYLFPILGYWTSFDEIPLSQLPEEFVLKCNHDSGSTRIIKNKSGLTPSDIERLRLHFRARLSRDFFYAGYEYPYKGIKPVIIAEKFMRAPNGQVPFDYKFFCFDGEPKIMYVATDRETDVKFTLFDMDFHRLDIDYTHGQETGIVEKPASFEQMKAIARTLSAGIKFVRIDLYELEEKPYFGEYTFFPGGGFYLMHPHEWELRLGDWIDLTKESKQKSLKHSY